MAPEDLEAMQRELDFWRYVGQILLMFLSFLVMLWLLID